MELAMTAGTLSAIVGQPDPGKLPARFRREEIAIGGPGVGKRSRTRASAQHHLIAHEFSVVLSQRALRRLVTGIRKIGARGSPPQHAQHPHPTLSFSKPCCPAV